MMQILPEMNHLNKVLNELQFDLESLSGITDDTERFNLLQSWIDESRTDGTLWALGYELKGWDRLVGRDLLFRCAYIVNDSRTTNEAINLLCAAQRCASLNDEQAALALVMLSNYPPDHDFVHYLNNRHNQ
jgi:hypothetical protein